MFDSALKPQACLEFFPFIALVNYLAAPKWRLRLEHWKQLGWMKKILLDCVRKAGVGDRVELKSRWKRGQN